MDFLEIEPEGNAQIKVVGVGGGGGNAINNMINSSLKGVSFIAANTDMQALKHSVAEHKLQLGERLTKGLGAGADPNIGKEAATESVESIKEMLGECDMVFVTAGMGGGTGTGAAPVIAQAAKEQGALTVGVVTKPFFFEGKRRLKAAEKGIEDLKDVVDSIITIPNDRLLSLASKKASFLEMLKKADEVLYYAVKGISDLIMVPGLINLDFADVKAVMSGMGLALMGTGIAQGEGRAKEAAIKAMTSPLLEDVSIDGAQGVLMNITSGMDLTIDEVSEAASAISEAASDDAQIYFGTVFDQEASDELRITVIATGIETKEKVEDREASNITSLKGFQQEKRPQKEKAAKGSSEDLTIPTYLRRENAGGAEQGEVKRFQQEHAPGDESGEQGEEEFVFEENEFEIPSFIRRQMD
ncbi:MAG: cell division protein FtsZ [Desulfohalobiaceae bacterium]|nr:cell division protein FtsZ [Desulfohalobiaceae bacterium]